VGHVAGAVVVVEPSALVGMLLLAAVFYAASAGLGAGALVVAVGFTLFLFVAFFMHGLAHGLAGRVLGHQPQALTLTLWGGHTSFRTNPSTPGRSALVAVAGPVMNLLLAAVTYTLWTVAEAHPLAAWVLLYATWINIVLGVFNLLPGLPADGGQVLEAVVWKITRRRATGTIVAAWIGRVVAVGIVVLALGVPYLNGTSPRLWSALWVVLIAWTLWSGATAALRHVRHTAAMSTVSLATVGTPAVGVVADTTLEQAEIALRAGGGKVVVVVLGDDGSPQGLVDARVLSEVPPEVYALTPVTAVTVPVPVGAVVDAGITGVGLVAALSRSGASLLVVTDAGRVVAVVTAAAVAQALDAGASGPSQVPA